MEILSLAEQVVTEYTHRGYRAAYRRGVVCGCRSCQGEMNRWLEWAEESQPAPTGIATHYSNLPQRSATPHDPLFD